MKPSKNRAALLGLIALTLPAATQADATKTVAEQGNPFSQGTVAVKLTPEQMADLSAYINQSQSALEQALADAKGMNLRTASSVYLEAVKKVVLESDRAHPRTELLMRVILNQALALTYGLPKADRNGLQSEGMLAHSSYQELLPAILKNSIELALQYTDQDRAAAKNGSFTDLPYAEVAQRRMIQVQTWMRSILEQPLAARLGIEALQQWLNIMMSEDQQHQAKYAAEIKIVADALNREATLARSPGLSSDVISGEQERLAHITMRKIVARIERSLGIVTLPPGSTAVSIGMTFVTIQPGTFVMGSPTSESGRYDNEVPHTVRLTRAFEMQTTDVTQALWTQIMSTNPSYFKGPKRPVEQVSWGDAQDFIQKLNARTNPGLDCGTFEKSQKTAGCYRLPTEAEWEYAARAGTQTAYSFGQGEDLMAQYAWYSTNSGSETHDVATLKPNAWGLYDMHGNVWQWVQDWYGDYGSNATNPQGPSSGYPRVIRGGSWYYDARYARSADRFYNSPGVHDDCLGFRLVRTQ